MKYALQSYKGLVIGAMVVIGAAAMPARMMADLPVDPATLQVAMIEVEDLVHARFFEPMFNANDTTAPSTLWQRFLELLKDEKNHKLILARFQQKKLSLDAFKQAWEEVVRRCKNRTKQEFTAIDFGKLLEQFKPVLPEKTKNIADKLGIKLVGVIKKRIACEPAVG